MGIIEAIFGLAFVIGITLAIINRITTTTGGWEGNKRMIECLRVFTVGFLGTLGIIGAGFLVGYLAQI